MSVADRLDPEVRAGLVPYFDFFGPGGMNAIKDLRERRARYADLLAAARAAQPPNERVTTTDTTAPGLNGGPAVPVRVYRPRDAGDEVLPALFFVHGGGMIMGSVAGEDTRVAGLAETLRCTAVSVEYRLAPEHPYPAPLDDCYAALTWTAAEADALRIDPSRIVVYGESAGSGLVAGLALLARDRGGPAIAFQMLIYPMLDDRNLTPSSNEIVDLGIWDRAANIEGWAAYLGAAAGGPDVPAYAAPARATDLRGLPPTYIDVGELDAFRDEDIDYATRLLQAGVPTELHVYPGALHGTQKFAPQAQVSARTVAYRIDSLRRALHPPSVAARPA
jgi:acetyl esterase/lipase